jgi:hypothetical protein
MYLALRIFLQGMDYLKIAARRLDPCHLGPPAIYGRCSPVLLVPGVLTHNSILNNINIYINNINI